VGLGDLSHLISFGASPRATLAFSEAARAVAFLRGRGYVVPEDVKEIAKDVLRHRILLTYEAEAENVTSDAVVDRILERVEVP
jgi:MoxR-like ATPase